MPESANAAGAANAPVASVGEERGSLARNAMGAMALAGSAAKTGAPEAWRSR